MKIVCILQYMIHKTCKALWDNFVGPLVAVVIVIGGPIALCMIVWAILPGVARVIIALMLLFALIVAILFQSIQHLVSLYREAREACDGT